MGKFQQHSKTDDKKIVTVQTYGMAPAFEPIEEVAHGEIAAFADSPKIKVTSQAITFDAEQAPILAQFWLNPPLQDGLLTVNPIYQKIKKIVIDYHLKHNDAFYSQYPELLILSKQERAAQATTPFTNEYLRINHRKFDRRLAHYIWHYYNASAMLIGAACNMCLLAQIDGPGKYHDYGEAFKLGRINNMLTRYKAFFKPSGYEDYFIKYSRMATGYTTYKALIAAFPLWVTDTKGSRGYGSASFSELFDGVLASGRDINRIVDNSEDLQDFLELQKNMDIVRAEFIRDDVRVDTSASPDEYHHSNFIADRCQALSDKIRGWSDGASSAGSQTFKVNPANFRDVVPSMPKIDNSATLTSQDGGDQQPTITGKLDSDGSIIYKSNTRVKVGDSTFVSNDNIINRVWDAINFWLEYNEKYFSKFSQPTSEMVRFCQEQGFIAKDTRSSSALFMTIKNQALSKPFDIMSLRDAMVYKRDNDVTTATQIKWMPIVDRWDDTWDDEEVDFDRNFNRYEVDLDDPVQVVLKARQFPSLTPVIFHNLGSTAESHDSDEPHVSNAITCGSLQLDNTHNTDVFPVHGILGKYASMLDFASSSHMDAEHTAIEVVAEDPKYAKAFIESANGIVMKETMDYPRAFVQPLIDRTDPYQCGFNVVFDANSYSETEQDRFYCSPERYQTPSSDTGGGVGYYKPIQAGLPTMPTYTASSDGNKYYQAGVDNPEWLNITRHPLLFLGDQIFYQPESSFGVLGIGNYAESYKQGDRKPSDNNFTATMLKAEQQLGTMKSSAQAQAGDYFHYDSRSVTTVSADSAMLPVLAGLVGALNASRQYAVPGYAASGESIQVLINMLACAKSNYGQVITCLFDPHFGGINIVKYDTPDFNLLATMGLVGLVYAAKSTRDPSFMLASKRQGSTATASNKIGVNILQLAFDSFDSVAQFLVWPVDNLRFRKVRRAGRRLFVPDAFVSISGFSGPAKTALALLSRAQVMYSGSEDTWYLNSLPEDKQKPLPGEQVAETGGKIDFGGLINSPEVATKLIPRRTFKARFNHKVIKSAQVSSDTYSAASKQAQSQSSSSDDFENENKSKFNANPKKGNKKWEKKDYPKKDEREEPEPSKEEKDLAQTASDSNS